MTWERTNTAKGPQYRAALLGHRVTVWKPYDARRWEWEIRGAPRFRQLAGGNERTMANAQDVAMRIVYGRVARGFG